MILALNLHRHPHEKFLSSLRKRLDHGFHWWKSVATIAREHNINYGIDAEIGGESSNDLFKWQRPEWHCSG